MQPLRIGLNSATTDTATIQVTCDFDRVKGRALLVTTRFRRVKSPKQATPPLNVCSLSVQG